VHLRLAKYVVVKPSHKRQQSDAASRKNDEISQVCKTPIYLQNMFWYYFMEPISDISILLDFQPFLLCAISSSELQGT
jgi:hypothetical protein